MMKKRVLMPLIVAGMMVASVVSLDSCTKKEEQPTKDFFEKLDVPYLTEEAVYREDGAVLDCPYCDVDILPGGFHWHAFGDAPEGFNTHYFLPGDPQGVGDCASTIGSNACPYSGRLEGNAIAIQYYIDHGVPAELAPYCVLPRFHAHLVTYELMYDPATGDGGEENHWHVGGGVPFWPGYDPDDPSNTHTPTNP